MVNLKTQIPSETPGDVVSFQKGRSIISLNQDELEYITNVAYLVAHSPMSIGTQPDPPAAGRILPITSTSSDSVAA